MVETVPQGSWATVPATSPGYGPPARFATRMRGYRIIGATLSLLVLAVLWGIAVNTRTGQLVDTLTMDAAGAHLDLGIASSRALGALVSLPTLIAIGIFILVVTTVRGRLGLAVRAVLVFAGANVATQLLKDHLSRPRLGIGHPLENSFPSGHVTVVASLSVVLIAIVPIGARALMTYVSAALTSLVGVVVMSLGWHRLSDVVAAIAISAFFGLLALPSEWVPQRPRIWGSFLAWVSTLAVIASVIALFVVILKLPFGPGVVTAQTINNVASHPNPGVYVAVICVGIIVGSSGIMASSIDRLAGGTPR